MAVLFYSFSTTFLGEMGDKSQVTIIILASSHNPYFVALGSLLVNV
jgi:putative Ca2+/H+ antiporter (TMEM165/GDT1 family)